MSRRVDERGIRDAMGLSMYERQVLSGIADEMRREDPRFAARMDQFGSAQPALPPQPERRRGTGPNRRRRIIVAVVGALIAVVLAVLAVRSVDTPTAAGGLDIQRPAEPCPGPNSQYPGTKCVKEPAHYPPGRGVLR